MIFERDGLKNIFIMNNSDSQPTVTNAKRLLETLNPTCRSSSKNYHDNHLDALDLRTTTRGVPEAISAIRTIEQQSCELGVGAGGGLPLLLGAVELQESIFRVRKKPSQPVD
ncbi:hypothetical protein DPMN_167765 [Dreissena polymorpha]|uniref:Uncharacterized protein n=1 Tax=Dreissena polymorpha TaxID=45954 RepID=A0A9D4F3V4_DREPO|nr:hypothetical protein DPMN_167765 [Dreissena polymorpha]